jgi:glycosyltransferase involved in cell wall biosynthesis
MQKIIILGTDLHGEKTEQAAKLAKNFSEIDFVKDNYLTLSLQNRKPLNRENACLIIPKLASSKIIRKLFQAFVLPFYLLILRIFYSNIITFWAPQEHYAHFILKLMKLLRYNVAFTIISGYDRNYSYLENCKIIICQSDRMMKNITKNVSPSRMMKIYPTLDLDLFKPSSNKKYELIIPSVPYKLEDFEERGIYRIIEVLKTDKFNSVVILRSKEAHLYFKSLGLKKCKLIFKALEDKELAEIMGASKVMPLLYSGNVPDMPLSAIEGLACGCFLITSNNMGISEIIRKNNFGTVLKNYEKFEEEVDRAIKAKRKYSKKEVEKYFNKDKNSENYKKIREMLK